MINKQTTLDLNGPILSFVQQPTSVSICNAGIVTFVGIATATFPTQTPSNSATPTGSISYRWYDQNGQLTDNQSVSGSGTTSLELYNNLTNRQIFLRADYTPSAYGQDPITVSTARSTPNAINDTLDSSTATLSVYPSISIRSILNDKTVIQNNTADFSVQASASDGSNVSYQWQLNGIDLAEGTNTNSSFTPGPLVKTLTITDDLSGSTATTVDFTKLSTYSNFITGRTYTITANANIGTKIYAVGGGGGTDTYRGATGGSGGAAQGTFAFEKGKTYKLIVGGGAIGATGGSGGGGNGSTGGGGGGVSGGGGGYTGLFLNSVSQTNAILIAGGGGGGANDPAFGGSGGGLTGGNASNAPSRGGTGGTQSSGGTGGSSGSALQGGNGTAAGGGGGYFGGGGGYYNVTIGADGGGGGGSGYIHPTSITNGSFNATNSAGGGGPETNGSFKIDLDPNYTTSTSTTFTASGTKTQTLKISSNTIGLSQIRCKVTHPTSCDSPIYTNSVNFIVLAPRSILNIETFKETGTENAILTSLNLDESGSSITLNATNTQELTSLYAAEKDINVTMEMYGAPGGNVGGISGGQGGKSTISFTMKKNEEYVIGRIPQSGTNGGVFLYRKAKLIAAVGAGGNTGTLNGGGAGGGVNFSGVQGGVFFRRGGTGGTSPSTLLPDGIFGSIVSPTTTLLSGDTIETVPAGGRTISCSKGIYWRNEGYSACQDIGLVQFRRSDGSVVSNTATINRGFKAGYSILTTSGAGSNGGGNGGGGATGGNGGINGAGGGGGSGYTDGSITIVSTQQGGNTDVARIKIYLTPAPVPVVQYTAPIQYTAPTLPPVPGYFNVLDPNTTSDGVNSDYFAVGVSGPISQTRFSYSVTFSGGSFDSYRGNPPSGTFGGAAISPGWASLAINNPHPAGSISATISAPGYETYSYQMYIASTYK
jgi:hypothetical protein